MPKIKTNRGAAKRFRVTKSGKIKFSKAHRRHLLEDKTGKKSQKMRASSYIHPADERNVHRLIPYL